jgi:hypothetical protein
MMLMVVVMGLLMLLNCSIRIDGVDQEEEAVVGIYSITYCFKFFLITDSIILRFISTYLAALFRL